MNSFAFPPTLNEIKLDTMDHTARTTAQREASKTNGAMSKGPTTAAGKMVCAANPVVHGLSTRAALMPGETMADYQAHVDAWTATLSPASPGEAMVVARVADLAFRQARLARLEERLTVAAVEKALGASTSVKTLKVVSEALEGAQGLLALAGGVQGPVAAEAAARLLPAMRTVAKLADAADAPIPVSARLDAAIAALVDEHAAEVEPAAFARLAAAADDLVQALQAAKETAERDLEAERERLAEGAALADSRDLAVVERHRGRLSRAVDAELRTLRLLRELARPEALAPGPLVQPFLVEVRVLGRVRTTAAA
ncbi:MAG: hypothetical protein NDI82_10645 [Anaeromyxobacteraceae bacterium]|nr:hypothetical protein [Anaeromyxobacteraceae bacterium]